MPKTQTPIDKKLIKIGWSGVTAIFYLKIEPNNLYVFINNPINSFTT
jgi:hypothetical protein